MVLAVLAPLVVSDLGASFFDRIFATDASVSKGAIVSAPVSQKIARVLWRSCRSKGGYSKLLTPVQSTLSRCLDFEEDDTLATGPVTAHVDRPLAYRFDFIEVFAGSASVTRFMDATGFSTCVPIELSVDSELDVSKVHVLEWLAHLIQNRYVKAFMVEPPCTSFSIMRRPALRSVDFPFGFDPACHQVSIGNILAHRSLFLLYLGHRYGVAGMLENPWSSRIKNLPAWRRLVLYGFVLIRVPTDLSIAKLLVLSVSGSQRGGSEDAVIGRVFMFLWRALILRRVLPTPRCSQRLSLRLWLWRSLT